jgi:hypothetical protein
MAEGTWPRVRVPPRISAGASCAIGQQEIDTMVINVGIALWTTMLAIMWLAVGTAMHMPLTTQLGPLMVAGGLFVMARELRGR